MSDDLILFETKDKSVSIPVKVDGETVWLNRKQIALLFERDVKTIGKHINNAIREELPNQVVIANFATTTVHGAIPGKTQTHNTQYYNLDVIISVGYRVKSQRGIEFRQWTNKVLKQYILQGYAINQNRLEYLNKTVEIESRIIAHMTEIDTEELLSVINGYTNALNLLDDYDHQCVAKPEGNKIVSKLELTKCYEIISKMKFGNTSNLFGTEKEEGKLDAILSAVHQIAFG